MPYLLRLDCSGPLRSDGSKDVGQGEGLPAGESDDGEGSIMKFTVNGLARQDPCSAGAVRLDQAGSLQS